MTEKMQYPKKYFILDDDGYTQLLKKSQEPTHEVDVMKYNQKFLEDKKFDENQKDANWQNYGNRMAEVISDGVKAAAAPSTVVPEPLSSSDITDKLEQVLGKKYFNKGMRFYNLIKGVSGVQILPRGIHVDNEIIEGNSAMIIGNIVKNNAILAFPSEILLKKLILGGYGDQVKSLIDNKEGKKIVTSLLDISKSANMTLDSARTPVHSSTPVHERSGTKNKSRKRKSRIDSTLGEGDTSFYSEIHDEGSYSDALKKSGSNVIRWILLFGKNGSRGPKRRR